METAAKIWLRAREGVLALKPCRVPILMVAAGLAFLLVAAQGEDVARALAERRSAEAHAWQSFWFFAACLAWSLSAWYWARAMLFLRLPGVPPHSAALQGLRTWTPRLLGFVATLGVALAFYRASLGYAPQEHADVRALLLWYALWSLAGAVAFLVAVTARRRVARAAHARLKDRAGLRGPLGQRLVSTLDLPRKEEQVYGMLELRDLGLLTRVLLAAAILAAAVLFLVFVLAPQSAAPAMGSAAILLLAAAGWIAAGSTLDFAGMRLHFPVFLALLLVAVLCSFRNDNHAVPTLDAPQAASPPASRPDLREALRAWRLARQKEFSRGKARVPLYVVDAEGGGIRAAYWTATVLGEIQDRNPRFADHLFSLSGVSGGSLGASVFLAALVRSREDGAGAEKVKAVSQAVLGEDFLSPVVASLLYPDLLQRILPVPIKRFDRGATLEQSWVRAWQKHVPGRNRLAEPLDALWEDAAKRWTPALFLNATWVETGKRIIASNVRIAAEKGAEDFVDTEDAQAFFAPRSLSLASAAHMSARFTYVSPAGALVKDGRTYGRVVDGGYFENSGATTTLEILKTLANLADEDPAWARVEPFVIHISNEPVEARFASDTLASAPDNPLIAPRQFLNEALSPLRAMLNTRGARGLYARETLMWHVDRDHFLHFGLCRSSANVPLGWVLSQSTRERMEAQLSGARCAAPGAEPVFDNAGNLDKIRVRLGAAPRRRAPGAG